MAVIKKVGDGFKRLCAVLVACVVMWYSVITAPVFRVHGAFSFPVSLEGLIDWTYETASTSISALPGDLGSPVQYILDSVYSIFGTDGLADNAVSIYNDITNSGNATVISMSSSQGFTGYYTLDGLSTSKSGSIYTRDLSSCLSNTYFNLYSTSDFSFSFPLLQAVV